MKKRNWLVFGIIIAIMFSNFHFYYTLVLELQLLILYRLENKEGNERNG